MAAEAGFGDGVTKEFITELSKVAFSELYGMFLATPQKSIYPNPAAGMSRLVPIVKLL